MITPGINVTQLQGSAYDGAGYVGIGNEQSPLITIYYGITAKHPSRMQAEILAKKIAAAFPEICATAEVQL